MPFALQPQHHMMSACCQAQHHTPRTLLSSPSTVCTLAFRSAARALRLTAPHRLSASAASSRRCALLLGVGPYGRRVRRAAAACSLLYCSQRCCVSESSGRKAAGKESSQGRCWEEAKTCCAAPSAAKQADRHGVQHCMHHQAHSIRRLFCTRATPHLKYARLPVVVNITEAIPNLCMLGTCHKLKSSRGSVPCMAQGEWMQVGM